MAKNGNNLESEITKKEEELKKLRAAKRAQDDKVHLVIGKAIKTHMDQEPSFNGQIMAILDEALTGRRDRELVGLGDRVNTQAAE